MNFYTKNNLLVAGPTSGKSFLADKLTKTGLPVLDTDDIINQYVPNYWAIARDRSLSGKVKELIDVSTDLLCANEILSSMPKLVVTVSWGRVFMNKLFIPRKSEKIGHIFVARANPLEVTRISRDRGFALSTGLVGKWNNVAENHAPKHFDHVIWLPENVYLSDVVVGTPKGWSLSHLGEALSKMKRSEVLKITMDDLVGQGFVKGGSND